MTWQEHALCAQKDPEVWFPERGGGWLGSMNQAKRTCAKCPVRQPCLEYAIDLQPDYGIWAGYSARHLKEMKREATT